MKKNKYGMRILLLSIMACMMLSVSFTNKVQAQPITPAASVEIVVDDMTFKLDTDTLTATIIDASDTIVKDLTIPSTVTYNGQNYAVTEIGNSAFANCQLTNLVIPSSVITVGVFAFNNNKLENINLVDGLKTIAGYAFGGNELTNVTIPDSVITIGDSSFYSNNLTSVSIGNNVKYIQVGAFMHNKLTDVTIPDSVETIEMFAFSSNQLSSIKIGSKVTIIGTGAFGVNKLTSVIIPDSVTTIESTAFYSNPLTSITIPSSVIKAGRELFYNVPLEYIYIPHVKDYEHTLSVLTNPGPLPTNAPLASITATNVKLYALDNIQAKYTTDTLNRYILEQDGNPVLKVDNIINPELKRYVAATNMWNNPANESLPVDNATIEWYKVLSDGSSSLVGSGAMLTATEPGTYFAKINDTIQLGNIQVYQTISDVPVIPNADNQLTLVKTGNQMKVLDIATILVAAFGITTVVAKRKKTIN